VAVSGPLVVVKVGGDVLLDEAQRLGLGENVAALEEEGARVIVLHGGGPQTTALQQQLGLVARKVAGRRVTTPQDLRVVVQAICGEVNTGLVSTLLAAGVRAFGCHGASGKLVLAHKRPPMSVEGPENPSGAPIDYGEVGDVDRIDAALLHGLLGLGLVPVVATLGVGEDGRLFNINADTTAVQVAKAVKADLLLLVTAVGGVFRDLRDPKTRLATLTPASCEALIADGTIAGGMIPKVEEAVSILDEGVGAVAILGAQQEGAFVSALRGDGAVGTRFQRR
jgi:acetylglutamate kinase